MKSPLHTILATLVLVSCAPEAVELPCPPWTPPNSYVCRDAEGRRYCQTACCGC